MKIYAELRNKKVDVYALIFLFILYIIFLTPVIYEQRAVGDFGAHVDFAKMITRDGIIPKVNLLYHFIIIGINLIFPFIGLYSSGVITVVLFNSVFGLLLYDYLRPILGKEQSHIYSFITICMVFLLELVAPISFFTWKEHNLLFGYISPTLYHSPTSILIKPLSLLLFIFAVKQFNSKAITVKLKNIAFGALLVILSALAKPSFLICILPALVIYSVIKYLVKAPLNLNLQILGIFLPAAIVLSIQYYFHFNPDPNKIVFQGGSVAIAPFAFMALASTGLLPKFFLSILFPLGVYLSNFHQAKKNDELNFSWIIFFCGVFYTYMVVETKTLVMGNFASTGGITLLILFISSLKFFVINLKEEIDKVGFMNISSKQILNLGVLTLHFICGIPWYFVYFIGNDNFM